MEAISALHTAARRFCIEQDTYWIGEYQKLQSFSELSYKLFPRYRLAQATLIEIERVTPNQSSALDQMRKTLEAAGENALTPLLDEFKGKTLSVAALKDQALAYAKFIEGLSSRELERVEPLPYRRVLSQEESVSLWQSLESRWSIRGQGYGWYPISDAAAPEGAVAVHEELWRERGGDGLLLRFLEAHAVQRCFLIRELGPPDYEIERSIVTPYYDGSELFLTNNDDWILYASHESSMTLVGSLADFFRSAWPDCDQLSYNGPFHTADLRGSWEYLPASIR
jgi:hypothetical protein